MRDLAAATLFAGFVAAAAWAAWPKLPEAARRRRLSWFALYTLGATCGSALSRRDFYPFVPWDLVCCVLPDSVMQPGLRVVDGTGRTWPLDYRAFAPLSPDELVSWTADNFWRLSAAQQDEAAAWIVARADSAAARVRAGKHPGKRLLGPLTAPFFVLHKRFWDDRDSVPPEVSGLEVTYDFWNLDARARDPSAFRREIRYRYPRP